MATSGESVSKDDCSRVVVVDGSDDDDTDNDNKRRTHAFSLCVKNERERLLYTSQSHYVTVYTVTSPSQLTNRNRPPHSGPRFLLMYTGSYSLSACLASVCFVRKNFKGRQSRP